MIEITVKVYHSIEELREGLDRPDYSDAEIKAYLEQIAFDRLSDELYNQGVGQ